MTRHDARMSNIIQYWRRNVRRGVGVGQMIVRHRQAADWRKAGRSVLWVVIIPLVVAALTLWHPIFLLLLLLYPFRWLKIFWSLRSFAWSSSDRSLWATHCLVADLPNVVGLISFAMNRLLGRQPRLIEYHPAANP
jgi:hypothetical protein